MQINWEVRNRFRLFREERDFLLHVESARNRSILAAEQSLELQSEGRGWARNMVNRLCIDLQGRVNQPCTRDNVKENYLTPIDHPITVRLTGAVPVGATCAWSFDDGDGPQTSTFDCAEPVNLRVRYGSRPSRASTSPPAPIRRQRVQTEIQVRDIFIAGLGDSIASGEGNPDRPLALSDEGFCFRSYLGTARRRSITGRAAPASRAAAPARRRIRSRTGSTTARSGSTRPATARSTATRPAPRSRSRCAIPTSP